jgi:two-component system, OmpR family, sensor histidine kinase KdpD
LTVGREHNGCVAVLRRTELGARRRAFGWLVALAGPAGLTVLMKHGGQTPTVEALGFLALTVLCAIVGGMWPALVAAVLGCLLLNYFFTPPLHTLQVDHVANVLSLGLFLLVAVAVASVVDLAARRTAQAVAAGLEADRLAAERVELAEQAAAADLLAQGNRLRTALLAAVSHDLRTPLAGIKAAVTTLRTPDVSWTPQEQEELLAAIEESADRLAALIANLLDLSRLQTGGLPSARHEIGLDDVVANALTGLSEEGRVSLELPDDLPGVRVDAGLLERVVANLVDNALRHTSAHVEVLADTDGAHVRLVVADHGKGVPAEARQSMFEPFQRLGDAPAGEGVGLGLAVARGLTEAMDGTIAASETVGGGLTMTVTLPAVATGPLPRLEGSEP